MLFAVKDKRFVLKFVLFLLFGIQEERKIPDPPASAMRRSTMSSSENPDTAERISGLCYKIYSVESVESVIWCIYCI